ncbi:MAG: hypothetical protein ACO3FI_01145 [Cyclobacteriaceae bacterium]
MSSFRYFFLSLLLGAAVSLISVSISLTAGLPRPSFLFEITVLYSLWNALIYKLFFTTSDKETFVSRYMTALVVKFTFILLSMVAIGMADREGIVANTVFIAFNYIIFLVLEISVLYRRVNLPK